MKRFIVYDPQTGFILRTGSCQDGMLEKQAHDSERAIEGIASDTEHRIENGKIVLKAGTAAMQKGRSPREVLIQKRMTRILRDQAVADLVAKGLIEQS